MLKTQHKKSGCAFLHKGYNKGNHSLSGVMSCSMIWTECLFWFTPATCSCATQDTTEPYTSLWWCTNTNILLWNLLFTSNKWHNSFVSHSVWFIERSVELPCWRQSEQTFRYLSAAAVFRRPQSNCQWNRTTTKMNRWKVLIGAEDEWCPRF